MSDTTNIILIIFYIFFVSVGLLFFFNITYRYIGRLSGIDLIVVFVVVVAMGAFVLNLLVFTKGYADTRNAQRSQDVETISNAVAGFVEDSRTRVQQLGPLPVCPNTAPIGSAAGNIDLATKLTDTLTSMPTDPTDGSLEDTGYAICRTLTLRVQISAPKAENGKLISFKQ